MTYVEHTWVNGETITAEKMNNIENGIEEAASSGGMEFPFITINKEMSSGDHYIYFYLCTYNEAEEGYDAISLPYLDGGNTAEINIGGYSRTEYIWSPLPIPPVEGLYLIMGVYNDWTASVGGDINPTPVNVYYGSTIRGFIITGNGTLTVSD